MSPRESPLLDTVDALALAACAGAGLVSVLLGLLHFVLLPGLRPWSLGSIGAVLLLALAGFPGLVAGFAGVGGEWALCAACFGLPLLMSAPYSSSRSGGRRYIPLPSKKVAVMVSLLASSVSVLLIGVLLSLGPDSTLVPSKGSSPPAYLTPRGFSTVRVSNQDEPIVNYYPYVALTGHRRHGSSVGGVYLLGGDHVDVANLNILPNSHAPVLAVDSCNVTFTNLSVQCGSRPCIVARRCVEEALFKGVRAEINGTALPLATEISWIDASHPLEGGGASHVALLHSDFEPSWHVIARHLPVVVGGVRDTMYLIARVGRWAWIEVGAPLTSFLWGTVAPSCITFVSEMGFLLKVGTCGSLDGLSNLMLSDALAPKSTLRDAGLWMCGSTLEVIQLAEESFLESSPMTNNNMVPQEELLSAIAGGVQMLEVTLFNTQRDLMWLAAHTGVPWVFRTVVEAARADSELFVWHWNTVASALLTPTVVVLSRSYTCLNYLMPSLFQIEGGTDQISQWVHSLGSIGMSNLMELVYVILGLLWAMMVALAGMVLYSLQWFWDLSISTLIHIFANTSTIFDGLYWLVSFAVDSLYTVLVWVVLTGINVGRYAISLYASCSLYTHLFVCTLQTGIIILALLREVKRGSGEGSIHWYQYVYRIVNLYYQNLRPVIVYSVAHLVGIVLAVGTSFLPLSGTTGLHFLVVQIVLPVASTYGFVFFMRDDSITGTSQTEGEEQDRQVVVALQGEDHNDRLEIAKWKKMRAREVAIRKKTAVSFAFRAVCTVVLQKCVGDIVAVIVGELLMVGGIFGVVVVGVLYLKARGGVSNSTSVVDAPTAAAKIE